MDLDLRRGKHPAVAGIFVALFLFVMLFTAGMGYLLYTQSANSSSYKASENALASHLGAEEEQLVFEGTNCVANVLTLTINNTGGIPTSVVSVFVKNSAGQLTAPGVMSLGGPDTNATGPMNLGVGEQGYLELTGYSYNCFTEPLVYIYVTTSRGNVFSSQFPTTAVETTTTILSSVFTSITAPNGGGGNSLVVVMVATPVQVFSGNTIIDNVTVFNYASTSMTDVTLQSTSAAYPNVPAFQTTGTASLTNPSCAGPYTPPGQQSDPTATIPGFSGVGIAPHIYYVCSFTASTGTVGGLASFTGWAHGLQGTQTVESEGATSNIVQIGGLVNVLSEGVFSSNFFFFKYTSCTNQPSGGGFGHGGGSYTYPSGCSENIAIPPASIYSIPDGSVISGGSNYYTAFYVQITNNFNTPLPILQYTFDQFEDSAGTETDFWIVGTNTAMTNGAYYPDYAPGGTSVPTLTAYPTDCATVNNNNIPNDKNCIYVNPGQSVVLTLAACGPGSASWDWGGTQRATQFDSGATGCVSPAPSFSSSGSANAAVTVISFEYNGQILTQDLAFQGVAVTS